MISRLSAFAALFAVLTTATLAFAATAHQSETLRAAAQPIRVVQLERIVVIGHRMPAGQR